MSYINLLDIIYPVGSFYFSTEYDSPSQIIGGNWEQIDGAVIRAASTDESSTINYLGSDTCTLAATQMPAHTHSCSRVQWHNNSTSTRAIGVYVGGAYYGCNIATSNSPLRVDDGLKGSTSSTGGGEAHSIMQRSFNCYIWRRVS